LRAIRRLQARTIGDYPAVVVVLPQEVLIFFGPSATDQATVCSTT
jgi:hypothetical protein